MKYELEDGRYLMKSYRDIRDFFNEHNITNKTIIDIRPAEIDFIIRNIGEVFDNPEEAVLYTTSCGIDTDGRICIVFADNTTLEVEFSGEGPILLGYNTACLKSYPEYDGLCYKLSTMFGKCIGRFITHVDFEKSDSRMTFPTRRVESGEYIDLSDDDDGVCEIRFCLDDGSVLRTCGYTDWFRMELFAPNGEEETVSFKKLLDDLNEEAIEGIFCEEKGI